MLCPMGQRAVEVEPVTFPGCCAELPETNSVALVTYGFMVCLLTWLLLRDIGGCSLLSPYLLLVIASYLDVS